MLVCLIMTRRSSGITAPSPGGSHSKSSSSSSKLHTPRGVGGRISILSPSSLSSSNQKQQQQQQQQQQHHLGHGGGAIQRGSHSAFKVMKRSLDRLSSTTSTLTLPDDDCDNNDGTEVEESTESVKVCVRIRPLQIEDVKNGQNQAPRAYVLGSVKNTIVKNSEIFSDKSNSSNSTYSFNHVYGESSTTRQLYEDMIAEIVQSVGCQGRNGTVFTYGQTSTGE